jgi:tetratricopeptide (TPR) repeat protein
MKNLFKEGNRRYIKGDYKGAIKCFSKLVENEPDNVYGHINLGIAKMDVGNYEEAIKCFSRAIELEPGNADAYRNRALAYYSLNIEDKALTDYKKSGELSLYK